MRRPKLHCRRLPTLLAILLAVAPAAAEMLRVGPGERFAGPSKAACAGKSDDGVVVPPDVYHDCAVWRAADVTIEAAPGDPCEMSLIVCFEA